MSVLVFIIFAVVLTGILLAVSILVNPMLGIFIASLLTCLWMEFQKDGCKKS